MLYSEGSLELNTADGVRIADGVSTPEGDPIGGARPATTDKSDPRAGAADAASRSTLSSDSPVTGVLFSLTGGTCPRLGLRLRVVRMLADVQLLADVLSLRMRMCTGPGTGTVPSGNVGKTQGITGDAMMKLA